MDNAQTIGWLCQNAELLERKAAGRPDAQTRLTTLKADAAAGKEIVAAAEQLRKDLRMQSPGAVRMVTPPGLGPGAPVVEIYGCPAEACARHWVRQSGMATPSCALHSAPLRHVPDPST